MTDDLIVHHTLRCPRCKGDSGGSVDHLLTRNRTSFGPWYCKKCGGAFSGVADGGKITVSVDDKAVEFKPVLVLLKREEGAIWFVLKETRCDDEDDTPEQIQESGRFRYESHSCPTNWIVRTVMMVADGSDDPHGCLEFVRSVDIGPDFNETDENILEKLPELREALKE